LLFVPAAAVRALNLTLVDRRPFFFYLFQSPTPPQYVFWYHNNRMINYDTTRGSVTVQTDPGPTQSRLTIRQAVESDTGNYTCSASNTKPASIFVFVTEGKYKGQELSFARDAVESSIDTSVALSPRFRFLRSVPQVFPMSKHRQRPFSAG
jgi:hypothetical protein